MTKSRATKIKQLYEGAMSSGGLPVFKERFEQAIGLHTNANTGLKEFDPNRRDVDYMSFDIGALAEGTMGSGWRETFEQHWQAATKLRFEGTGTSVLPGELSYVSAFLDTIAGLVNARALQIAKSPEYIWDRFCTPQEYVGTGGFDIGVRSSGQQPNFDLAYGQDIPTVKNLGTRVHRNRPLNAGLRTGLNKYTVLDDLTGQLMQGVEQNALQVLFERERKVADCVLGIASGTTVATGDQIGTPGLAIPMQQDGLVFYPWQDGVWGTNANATTASPENQRLIANYANSSTTNGSGLLNYAQFVTMLQVLNTNRDPFTALPPNVDFNGMTILVAPAARVQVEYLLQAKALWEIANYGFNPGLGSATTVGSATVSDYNLVEKLGMKVETSQYWFNRMVDVGVIKVASNGTKTHQALTNAASDTYNTAGSIMSAFYMGHFKDAVNYHVRMPYSVIQVPLSSIEYGNETVMLTDVREFGAPYWHNPRVVWRAWA